LPEAVWEHLDSEANGNRSDYLRKLIDHDMWSQGDWSNNACQGYAILAAKELGYSDDEISKLVRAIYRAFDFKTIDEARTAYEQSPY
jgi:Holliday junction resolvasome RuvABC DNA-binding subunit